MSAGFHVHFDVIAEASKDWHKVINGSHFINSTHIPRRVSFVHVDTRRGRVTTLTSRCTRGQLQKNHVTTVTAVQRGVAQWNCISTGPKKKYKVINTAEYRDDAQKLHCVFTFLNLQLHITSEYSGVHRGRTRRCEWGYWKNLVWLLLCGKH